MVLILAQRPGTAASANARVAPGAFTIVAGAAHNPKLEASRSTPQRWLFIRDDSGWQVAATGVTVFGPDGRASPPGTP